MRSTFLLRASDNFPFKTIVAHNLAATAAFPDNAAVAPGELAGYL